jgi:hypothetical protein
MRTVECRNAYIAASQSNVSASLRVDLLHSMLKIIKAVDGRCLHSDDVSP